MKPEEIVELTVKIIDAIARGATAVARIVADYKERRRRRREAAVAASGSAPASPSSAVPADKKQVCSHLHSN